MPAIDVAVRSRAWRKALPGAARLCRKAAGAALAAAGTLPPAELSIVLADDKLLRRLNREWRGKDAPTNVLSFPAQDDIAAAGRTAPVGAPLPLGDVVLALSTVRQEAAAQGKALGDHVAHLVVHGVLHLLGEDHDQEAEAERMEARERAVLGGLGIADPYEPRAMHAEAMRG
jgi:probable rRNA maturation factor